LEARSAGKAKVLWELRSCGREFIKKSWRGSITLPNLPILPRIFEVIEVMKA
jgi:hypothetical protein